MPEGTTFYRQVKNPTPVFVPSAGNQTLPFCRKLMAKAEGFTSSFEFAVHVAFACADGKRRRMPPVLRRRAIDALLQGMCFYYDPLTNTVLRSAAELAEECGLVIVSAKGASDASKATRALKFLDETLGLIVYEPESQPCISFTPALFRALNVLPKAEGRLACMNSLVVAEGNADD
ncbi:hypothetical protein Q8V88_004013 [Enterobacter hormaechei]|nr:hypothetical protein [Enterobacter hormaechei]